ncbi:MAG: SMC family ATPase [Desulfuromonadales bacterium]
MQIISVRLKNIKSHKDSTLEFSPGINVLRGPNGVGKSTVFEAIGYALFGVDAQSFVGNVERFVSIGAQKGEVEVVFRLRDPKRYRVTRTVGAASKWLLAKEVGGDFEVEEHKDAKETEARIAELLGLDNGRSLSEQFELVIGPFQNEFLGPFVIRQPSKRRDRFDEILGIDTWRKTYKETRALSTAINGKVEVLQAEIGSRQEQLEALPLRKDERRTARKDLAASRDDLDKQRKALEAVEGRLVDFDRREQACRTLQSDIDKLGERIDNGREKVAGQKSLVEEAEKARKVLRETEAGKEAFEHAEARLTGLYEQVSRQRKLEGEAAGLDKQIATLGARCESESLAIDQTISEARAEEQAIAESRKATAVDAETQETAARRPELRAGIDRLRQQLGQLEGRRSNLEEGRDKLAGGVCPFFQEPCENIADRPPQDVFTDKFDELDRQRQRLDSELETLVQQENAAARAEDRIRESRVKLKGLDQQADKVAERLQRNEERRAALEKLQEERSAVQKQSAEKQKELKAFSRLQEEIAEAEQHRKQHREARDRYVANQRQAAEGEQRVSDLQKFETLLENLGEELKERRDALRHADKAYDAEEHSALRRQKDELRETVGLLRQKVENLEAAVVRLEAEIEKLVKIEKEVEARKARIKAYSEKQELVKFLRNKVFRNVSSYLSERFREEISLKADKIYRTIADVDEELAWGENYRIELRDMVEGELRSRVDDQLSGGQMMSAVVALRLALLQTIGARIAFFDEPTSNLDAVRRENLAHAFRAIDVGKEEVTEHWYDQLFLVSHDVAFTEVTDQMIELEE